MSLSRFIEALKAQPDPPCKECHHFRDCQLNYLACGLFLDYVGHDVSKKYLNRRPARKFYKQIFTDAQNLGATEGEMAEHRQIKGVPEWIQWTAEAWGKEMRRFEKKITHISSTTGRIADEGLVAAAIRGYGDHVPDVMFHDDEVRKFHMAWNDLDGGDRRLVYVHYKNYGPIKQKVEILSTNNRVYYRRLRSALCHMAANFWLYDE